MPNPPAEFPQSREGAAFAAVAAILRAALEGKGVKVRAYDGPQNDAVELSSNHGPVLRIFPRVGPSEIVTRAVNTVPLVVVLELHARGLRARDLVDFWGAARDAMARSRPYLGATVAAHLAADPVRCHRYSVNLPGYGAWEEKEPPASGLVGEGQITLWLQVPA